MVRIALVSSLASICILLHALRDKNAVMAQDLNLYGKMSSYLQALDTRELSSIASTCFPGLGFSSCVPILPEDDHVLADTLPYLVNLGELAGAEYCLQCCGYTTDYRDIWDLECPMTFSSPGLDAVYGFEMRMAANQYPGDTDIVTCPLRRNGCVYDENGGTVACEKTMDASAEKELIGLEYRIEVQQFQYNFLYWRGVSKCEITTYTGTTLLTSLNEDAFTEKYIVTYAPGHNGLIDYFNIIIVLVAVFAFIYIALYFCRRQHCVYCQQKLVISFNLCYKCYLVGAETPDPLMMKALEEKGIMLQGTLPERFPGATIFTNFCRAQSKIFYFCCVRSCVKFAGWVCSGTSKTTDAVIYAEEIEDEEAAAGSIRGSKKSSKFQKQSKFNDEASAKERMASEKRKQRKKGKKKHVNPNILAYPPEAIYRGVKHPNPPFKSREEIEKEEMALAEAAAAAEALKSAQIAASAEESDEAEEEEEDENGVGRFGNAEDEQESEGVEYESKDFEEEEEEESFSTAPSSKPAPSSKLGGTSRSKS